MTERGNQRTLMVVTFKTPRHSHILYIRAPKKGPLYRKVRDTSVASSALVNGVILVCPSLIFKFTLINSLKTCLKLNFFYQLFHFLF